jgi:hypothetical protein
VILSNADLKDKLNCKQDKPLIDWLNKHRVKWTEDTKGKPITTLAEFEQGLFGTVSTEPEFM